MSFIRGGETITIKRRATGVTDDDFGNATHTVSTVTIKNALIAMGSTSEPIDPERDAIDAALTLYLPQGTEILAGDRFVIRGTEWVKDGNAQEWVSPFAMQTGVVVQVRKRVG